MKQILTFFFLGFFMLGSGNNGLKAETTPAEEGGAKSFISAMGKKAIDVLTDKSKSQSQREKVFLDILNQDFAVGSMGKFVLGIYWKRATDAERKEYLSLLPRMIAKSYAQRFRSYSGEVFEVTGVRLGSDKGAIVTSTIKRPNGQNIPVNWRVYKSGKYRIFDVYVEGVSMAITQRSEFYSIIQRGGGNVESLLKSLRARVSGKQETENRSQESGEE